MSVSYYSTYELIINQVAAELKEGNSWEQSIPDLIYEKTDLFINASTLTPPEKVFGTMVLFEKYGVNENYILEEVNDTSFTSNIDMAYTDAVVSALHSEIKERLGDDSAKDDLVTKDYNTDIPLSVRLAKMPEPVSIVELLLSKLQRAGPDHRPREEELYNMVHNLLDEYRQLIWVNLGPAQKAHLIIQTENHYNATYAETEHNGYEWESIVDGQYLYEHFGNLLQDQYASAETLSEQQEEWIKMKLKDAKVRSV